MTRNNFFSPTRFMLLLRNDFILNYKKYLLTIISAFIVGYVVIYTHLPYKEYFDGYIMLRFYNGFTYCLMGFGFFVGLSFPGLNSKASSHSYLLMPCSIFEKYLSQFFIRIVIASVLFLMIFWVDAYLARATIISSSEFIGLASDYNSFSYSKLFMLVEDERIMKYATIIFMACLILYMFNVRIFFTKQASFKTAISLAGLILSVFMLLFLFSHIFYPETIGFDENITKYSVYEGYNNFDFWIIFMFSSSWIFLLPLGYFKLKEKQL